MNSSAPSDTLQNEHFNARRRGVISFWQTADYHAAIVRLKLLENLQGEFDQLEKEFDNLRSSMTWLRKQQDDESASRLLSYLNLLAPFFQSRNYHGELLWWFDAGLEAARRIQANPAKLLLYKGEAQYVLGRWGEANESWQLCAQASWDADESTYAQAIFALGRLQINEGNFKSALSTLTKAAQLFEKVGNRMMAIEVQTEVAAYHLNRRELDKALEMYLEIDQSLKANGAIESSDHSLLMLGVVYRQKKSYKEAIYYLSELYHRGEKVSHPASIATAAHHLAWTYLELGQMEEAQRLCGQALALYQEIQDPRGLSDGYEQFGAILLERGKSEKAIKYFRRSGDMRRMLGNQPGLVSSVRREALGYLFAGKYAQAALLSAKTLLLYLQLGLLSRQRMNALAKDFLRYLSKAFYLRTTKSRLRKPDPGSEV